jgi:hypothetical protein
LLRHCSERPCDTRARKCDEHAPPHRFPVPDVVLPCRLKLVVSAFLLIAVVIVVWYAANAINEYFHDVPADVLGAVVIAFFGALLYLWGVSSLGLKFGLLEGKPAILIMSSGLIVFFVLWLALMRHSGMI